MLLILCRDEAATRKRFVGVPVAHLAQQGSHVLGFDQLQANGNGLVPAFRYAAAEGATAACDSHRSACSPSALFPCMRGQFQSASSSALSALQQRWLLGPEWQGCTTDSLYLQTWDLCSRTGSGVVLVCFLLTTMRKPPCSALAQRHAQQCQER